MTLFDRRTILAGGAGLALTAGVSPGLARARPERWVFDDLKSVGGHAVTAYGDPRLIDSPYGRATLFDGVDDRLVIDTHPLAGAPRFTFEAIFRPDGGAEAQRWFHLESAETPPVAPGKSNTRILFELRVVGQQWYLDAFMVGQGYRQAMMATDKLFPVGRWYHVAQTFDGSHYRSYVDGQLQMETALTFTPQGPGRSTVGARANAVDHFRGAIREARFTDHALAPRAFALPRKPRR